MFFASFYEVDDVKDIHDKALALELYEKLAKNVEAAERKAGQLLAEMREKGERAKGGGDLRKEFHPATLSDFEAMLNSSKSCATYSLTKLE
jgi:hypothetical protein